MKNKIFEHGYLRMKYYDDFGKPWDQLPLEEQAEAKVLHDEIQELQAEIEVLWRNRVDTD